MSETALELSTEFLAIAICSACHAKFIVDCKCSELVRTFVTCGLAYPVEDRIPVPLIDQARNTQ